MSPKGNPHVHETVSLEQALEKRNQAKLKRTKSREAILRHLVEHHGPFSAKELQLALKRKDLDTVTTYRCLASFEEAGLVRRCEFGDGLARFEESEHHHHHVICVSCRKIEKLEDCHLEKLEEKVKLMGYAKVSHVLEFTGLCRGCSKKAS